MATLPNTKRLFCPHCTPEVPKSTWYRHFKEFYDSSSNTWKTAKPTQSNVYLESDFDFGLDCDDIQETQEENELPAAIDYAAADSIDSNSDLDPDYEEPMETVNWLVLIHI